MIQFFLQMMERLCSRWVGQFLFQGYFIRPWWDSVQFYDNLLLFILILFFVLGIWVRVLCTSKEKTKKIPQRVMAFGISLILFIQMADSVTDSHCAGPEDNHPRYRNQPLLKDGSTAPELSLGPPTGSAGLEAGTSATVPSAEETNEASSSTRSSRKKMNPFERYLQEREDKALLMNYLENDATEKEKHTYEENARKMEEEEEAKRQARREYDRRRYENRKNKK